MVKCLRIVLSIKTALTAWFLSRARCQWWKLSYLNLSKLVNLLISALVFQSLHIVVLCLPRLSPLVAFLSPLVWKQQIDLFIILLLFYGTISHLIYVSLFIMSLLLLFQTHLYLTFQPLIYLRSWKSTSFTLPFILSLYSPRLSQDWYLRYWPSFVFSSHTHFVIIYRHIIHANVLCYSTCKCLLI